MCVPLVACASDPSVLLVASAKLLLTDMLQM